MIDDLFLFDDMFYKKINGNFVILTKERVFTDEEIKNRDKILAQLKQELKRIESENE